MSKHLPQVLGIFVLLFSVLTISYLSTNTIQRFGEAATADIPRDIQISNITDNSFTVSYVTDASVTGSIAYGKDTKLGSVAFDTRDNPTPMPHKLHYIRISNLAPNTKYFFSTISGEATSAENVTNEITTASSLENNSKKSPTITGSVTLSDSSIPIEAISYVQTNNSQLLSTLIDSTGSYSLDLANIRSKDLTSFHSLTENTSLSMTILNSEAQSKITFLASQANPIPPITLSKNYDFSTSNQPLATSLASESAQITGFPKVETSTASNAPQILTPKSEQEFKDQQPLFEGKALPGKTVEITIESDPIAATVQTNQSGNWEFRPNVKLTPGKHTITIKTPNAQGILQTLKRSFTIYAEGSQFVEPSISPTIPPTTTPTPTPAPTSQPTSIITAIPTPITVTTMPSVSIPTTTPIAQITTPPIPNAGSSNLLFGILGLGSIISIGSLLFFLL